MCESGTLRCPWRKEASAQASFLAIRHGQLFVEMQMGPVTFEMWVDAEFDGFVGGS